MSAPPLTQALVDDLKPRETTHTLRDGALRGFGVRVLPSGRKRFFLHIQNDGRRIWKIVGDADTLRLAVALERHEVRRPALVALVRLLLLTGCRKSEIATLAWSSYREGHLFLPDSKTGDFFTPRPTKSSQFLSRPCAS